MRTNQIFELPCDSVELMNIVESARRYNYELLKQAEFNEVLYSKSTNKNIDLSSQYRYKIHLCKLLSDAIDERLHP